jgi:hypothetical protein
MPAVHTVELACKIVKEHFGQPAEVSSPVVIAITSCSLQLGRGNAVSFYLGEMNGLQRPR